jgi:hypothetical protein
MSNSISTLLIRNLRDVFGENDPRAGARPSTRSSPKMACSTAPRNWAIAGGSNGYQAALVTRQLTPGLTSLLPRTAGLPPFICLSIR